MGGEAETEEREGSQARAAKRPTEQRSTETLASRSAGSICVSADLANNETECDLPTCRAITPALRNMSE